jgi:hypothetical protein
MTKEANPSRVGPILTSTLGVLGFALSLLSLAWQMHVYREGLTDKASVKFYVSFLNDYKQLLAEHYWAKNRFAMAVAPDGIKKSELYAEVVNNGQHALYIKRVRLIRPCPETPDSDSINFQPIKGSPPGPIEPGAAITYKADRLWNFVDQPLDWNWVGDLHNPTLEPFCVTVESNKGSVGQTNEVSYVLFRSNKRLDARLKKQDAQTAVTTLHK